MYWRDATSRRVSLKVKDGRKEKKKGEKKKYDIQDYIYTFDDDEDDDKTLFSPRTSRRCRL